MQNKKLVMIPGPTPVVRSIQNELGRETVAFGTLLSSRPQNPHRSAQGDARLFRRSLYHFRNRNSGHGGRRCQQRQSGRQYSDFVQRLFR